MVEHDFDTLPAVVHNDSQLAVNRDQELLAEPVGMFTSHLVRYAINYERTLRNEGQVLAELYRRQIPAQVREMGQPPELAAANPKVHPGTRPFQQRRWLGAGCSLRRVRLIPHDHCRVADDDGIWRN